MKEGIHPQYGPAKVICACGKVWDIYSTRKEQKVGICAECHPFITGKRCRPRGKIPSPLRKERCKIICCCFYQMIRAEMNVFSSLCRIFFYRGNIFSLNTDGFSVDEQKDNAGRFCSNAKNRRF